jgi:hypothetical protein
MQLRARERTPETVRIEIAPHVNFQIIKEWRKRSPVPIKSRLGKLDMVLPAVEAVARPQENTGL